MIAIVEMTVIETTDGNPTLRRTPDDAMTLAHDSLTEDGAPANPTVNPGSIFMR
jgi:hypothetical protein